MSVPEKHIVCHAAQAWGHTRPLIHLAARIVKLRPGIVLTMLTTDSYYERVKIELARNFDENGLEDECANLKRIRVISAGRAVSIRSDEADRCFEDGWKTLIKECELVCTRTGIRYAPLPKPQAVILDMLSVKAFDTVKLLSGDSVQVYSWLPCAVSAVLHIFGPENLGGKGDIHAKAEEKARSTGESFNEVALEMTFGTEGKIVETPGMPPMFDYEHYPQHLQIPRASALFFRVHEVLEKVDGVLLLSPESYEPAAIEAMRAWFAATGRAVYTTGPLLPSASKSDAAILNEKKLSTDSNAIITFLDEIVTITGEKSLIYISFGSMVFPSRTPETLQGLIDVLIELNIPFILSHASRGAIIPHDIKKQVKAYGRGILSPWTPQQLILDHPAVGWFLTHGGNNSVLEAISSGVPLIIWPFETDQPFSAVHITENLQIGYELLEVRTGDGLRPICRTGYRPKGTVEAVKAEAREVLSKAYGKDGAQKWMKLQEIRRKVTSEWENGGSSRRDMCMFLDSL